MYPPPTPFFTCVQHVVFPVEAGLNRLLQNRSISPISLLESASGKEVQPQELEEEEPLVTPPLQLPANTSRRHTVAEVSTHFRLGSAPCKFAVPTHRYKNHTV